jgi:hypothetical protein
MGWDSKALPDRILKRMPKAERPGGNAGLTATEAEEKRISQLELEIHTQFWSFLRRNGFEDVEYSNPHRSTRARKGRPDFLICRRSRRLGIEFKVYPNKLSGAQEEFFAMAARQDNPCLCCYDYESATRAVLEFFGL